MDNEKQVDSASRVTLGRQYKTRCGYPVRIYATDGGASGSLVHGAAFLESLGWRFHEWLPSGRAWASDPVHEWDLIEVQ